MRKVKPVVLTFILLSLLGVKAFAVQRFPKPEFETGYTQPETVAPFFRTPFLEMMDVAVLLISLSLVSWLVLKKRSRKGVFWMSMFSLGYFGFYKQGCVCSIGSIQNVTLSLFDPGFVLPVTVVAFFIIPLVFTLFFGRTFCAGVCPFGALQDLVSFNPLKVGTRLNAVLGLFPFFYLGLAVLFAATGTDFIICRYDPFVGLFRFNASFGMFLFGGILLLSGIFIARPYCRFLCPYGVLLNWVSRFSRKHITITPAECIQCKLCENSCPYDAINIPVTRKDPESRELRLKKFILICLMIPVLSISFGWVGSRIHETLAGVNAKVRLAKELISPEMEKGQPESFEMTAFRSSGKQETAIYAEADAILKKFYRGGWILGAFIGLVFGLVIASRMMGIYHTDYVPNKGRCFSCTRCVAYCPVKPSTPTIT